MQQDYSALAAALTDWYEQNKRPLPWRRDKNPYHVWVSEIMLQQTRIEAVIEHYFAFLEALPTLEDLAAVDEEKLLKLWEGLGYYSRARNLKKAAVKIVRDFGGAFPTDFKTLRTLPGIGDYTAGAIASICFDEAVPAVDGNVLRVLSRVNADESNVLLPETKKKAHMLLCNIMPANAGAFNEGLMELGETLCLPNGQPLCDTCPISAFCQANRRGIAASLPVRIKSIQRKTQQKTVFILISPDGRIATCKRADQGLLAGMYELPNIDGFHDEKALLSRLREWNLDVKELHFTEKTKHIFTHITWQMECYTAVLKNTNDTFIWCTAEELESKYALPTAFSKCLGKC